MRLKRPRIKLDRPLPDEDEADLIPQPLGNKLPASRLLTEGDLPSVSLTDPPEENGKDKKTIQGMLDTLRDLERYIPLNETTSPSEDDQPPGDLLAIDPIPRGKNQFKDMTNRQAQAEVLKQVSLDLASISKPDMERALQKIQRGLLADLGEVAKSQMAVLLVNSATRLERLEHIFYNACARVGLIKINRSTRTVSIQPALKDGLLPIIQGKRLLLQTLDALRKQGTTTRRMSFTLGPDDEATEQEAWQYANEMSLILSGTPLRPLGAVKKMVLEETQKR